MEIWDFPTTPQTTRCNPMPTGSIDEYIKRAIDLGNRYLWLLVNMPQLRVDLIVDID